MEELHMPYMFMLKVIIGVYAFYAVVALVNWKGRV